MTSNIPEQFFSITEEEIVVNNKVPMLDSSLPIKRGWFPEKYSRGPGDFFDMNSYVAALRYFILGLLVVFCGIHGDYFLLYWHLIFGFEYSIPNLGQIQWYSRVSFFLGVFMCGTAFLNVCVIYKKRKAHQFSLKEEKIGVIDLFQKFPLLYDLVVGWSFLIALPLIFYTHPIDAMLGLFFGGIAYKINYVVFKRKSIAIPIRMVLNFFVGSAAILLWWTMSVTVNGFPDGWQDIPMLPLF